MYLNIDECYSPSTLMCTVLANLMRNNTLNENKRMYTFNGYGRIIIVKPPKFLTKLSIKNANALLKSIANLHNISNRFIIRDGKMIDLYSVKNIGLNYVQLKNVKNKRR